MREVVFELVSQIPGQLQARAQSPALTITAASLEELQHEAREALIQHYGPAHGAYRVRFRRSRPLSGSLLRPAAHCCTRQSAAAAEARSSAEPGIPLAQHRSERNAQPV